jgi:outer membrane protein assembly factor BamE
LGYYGTLGHRNNPFFVGFRNHWTMMTLRRLAVTVLLPLCLATAGCSVFRLATVQGNVLEQKQVDQLQTGMTPDQVRYLLGTPLLQDSFNPDHWDYVYYYRSPKSQTQQRTLSLYFENGHLARIVGQDDPDAHAGAASANESLEKAEKDIDTKSPADSSTPDSNTRPVTPP